LLLLSRGLFCVVFLACVMALPARAHAEKSEREVQARELFVLGKYAESLEIYAKLYAETAHPTYLRNVGRCYQNLGEADKAIASFREYLRQAKGLSSDERGVVEQYIREMQALKEKRQETSPPPERVTKATPPPDSDAKAKTPPERSLVSHPGPESPPPDSGARPRRTAALVVGAASVAALGVGAFFGVRAMSKQSDSDNLCPNNLCVGDGVALSQDAKSNARICDVAVGAGLIGAGIATYLFLSSSGSGEGAAHARTESKVRLTPQLGPTLAGLQAGVSW
jgi:serine/threonine-protein kinase